MLFRDEEGDSIHKVMLFLTRLTRLRQKEKLTRREWKTAAQQNYQ